MKPLIPPYYLLLKGKRNSKDLYALSDDQGKLTIPVFTDIIMLDYYIKKSKVLLTPTMMNHDHHLLMLLRAISPLTVTQWVTVNPTLHACGKNSKGECFGLEQIIASLKRTIKATNRRRNKNNKKKSRKKKSHKK